MSENSACVVVTRHAALVQLLRELELVGDDVRVIAHATIEDVRGKHVFGVLPLHLAAEAWRVTEVPLALEEEDRGKELPLSRLREIGQPPVTYIVRREQKCSVCGGTDPDPGSPQMGHLTSPEGLILGSVHFECA